MIFNSIYVVNRLCALAASVYTSKIVCCITVIPASSDAKLNYYCGECQTCKVTGTIWKISVFPNVQVTKTFIMRQFNVVNIEKSVVWTGLFGQYVFCSFCLVIGA